MVLKRRLPWVVAIVLAAAGLLFLRGGGDEYTVDVVMPSATNLVPGSPVKIDGFDAGKVRDLQVKGGKAVVTVGVSEDFAPLHDGTSAQISWKALLGERILELQPGADKNAEIPSGGLLKGTSDRVELDQVLAALDPTTRKRLNTLLASLDSTLDGSQDDLSRTLAQAGPAVQAVGEVVRAVGDDGPAIRNLVKQLDAMTQVVAGRQDEVASTVSSFSTMVSQVAAQRSALQEGIDELPETLKAARSTLDEVPSTVDEAKPLVDDLAPAAQRLPGLVKYLQPVMQDLQPAVASLRPTLQSLQSLLGVTPGLLDETHETLPGLNDAADSAAPALGFLRPYMPELAGWLSNWASAAGNYDSNGHYMRTVIQEGASSVNVNPGIMPPGITRDAQRDPGENEGQSWTDATGSGLR
ncbi:hypothetical protein ASD11_14365 [Aeromicrobium sp. Root495]|uniref:MlaD family protein n=1 Tax=Aeromicrobium sp. Root495 TaxID=1736550 RepID=UPI0006FE7368|nr:MlaD family protein [Aeromicrobium sp. Root495]KQY55695.1 hypothetical protein ASD11_14365 [Aeromicrobium sp. Root495]